MQNVAARVFIALLWLLQLLPLSMLAVLGRGLGRFLYEVAGSRRRVALRNLELCFPQWPYAKREQVAREHFEWLARSILERGVLWFASEQRVRRLIQVEGEPRLTERSDRPVMWLVPHFVGLDIAAVSAQLFQGRMACSMYQRQSNPVMDAAIRRGRLRFGQVEIFPRSDKALPLVRAIRKGHAFFNLPDMDFGARDAAFVPFFGVSAATLLAPSRMARALDMVVQPVVAELLPGGQGYRVRFMAPLPGFPSDDPLADTQALNRFIEARILENPAQYLWVHKRFKTRPEGEPPLY